MGSLGKGLQICADCGNNNTDGFTTTIKAVDNQNASTEKVISDDPDEGCGAYFVCVKRTSPEGPEHPSGTHVGDHIGNTFIVFEDPPISATQNANMVWEFRTWEWTFVSNDHTKPVSAFGDPDFLYLYTGGYMRHEFGHILGLHDFYSDLKMRGLLAAMGSSFEVEEQDIEQLRAIYLHHISH